MDANLETVVRVFADNFEFQVLKPTGAPNDDSHLDIIFRRILLEICLMFKESTITLKTLDSSEVPIANVIKQKLTSIFLFSRTGIKIKTKLHESSRSVTNTFIAKEEVFGMKMFCLNEGTIVEKDVSYNAQIQQFKTIKDLRLKYLFCEIIGLPQISMVSLEKNSSSSSISMSPSRKIGPNKIFYKLPQVDVTDHGKDVWDIANEDDYIIKETDRRIAKSKSPLDNAHP